MYEHGLEAGCNFAAANVLLALINGMSRVLYTTPRDNAKQRFERAVENHYPWDNELKEPPFVNAVSNREGAHILYEMLRNPLAHELYLTLLY
jgi:hypothetical protein